MNFSIDQKVGQKEPVAYVAYTHLWFKDDDGVGLICLCSDVAAVSKYFYTTDTTTEDLRNANDYEEIYPGDSLTITF